MAFSHAEVPLIMEHSLYMNGPEGRRPTVKEKQLGTASYRSLHGSRGGRVVTIAANAMLRAQDDPGAWGQSINDKLGLPTG